MVILLGYLMAGFGAYLSLVHYGLQKDNADPPSNWVIIGWPVLYLLGIIDLINWVIKESKRE